MDIRPRDRVPGLLVVVAVAVFAHFLGGAIPKLDPLVVAILTGAVVANTLGVPKWAAPGLRLHKLILEVGIVLLGVRLPLGEIASSGPTIVALAVGVVAVGLLVVELLTRLVFPLNRKTGSVLAGASSICGVSAAAAVGGSIDVSESQLAYVAGTVLLFDAVTLVVFPILGGWLGLSQKVFGVWAGLSMFSTGPVAAAGFSYGSVAGQWATLTKLVRNSLIGIIAVGYSVVYADADEAAAHDSRLRFVWDQFPKFLVGFIVVVAAANLGVLSQDGIHLLDTGASWLFALAFAGLGFDIRLDEMRDAGLRPVIVTLCDLLVVSGLAYVAVTTLL